MEYSAARDRRANRASEQEGVFAAETIDLDAAKSDTVDLTDYPITIRCLGTGGVVKLLYARDLDANPRTIPIAYGEKLDIMVRRVYSSVTDATGLIGEYDDGPGLPS